MDQYQIKAEPQTRAYGRVTEEQPSQIQASPLETLAANGQPEGLMSPQVHQIDYNLSHKRMWIVMDN